MFDGSGCIALPGLVDSHTHAVFGAGRAHEFERRLAGSTYQEIAAAGGGILFSVRDLRSRSEDELVEISRPRIAEFARFGVTTIEVKSGYGLTVEDELKTLRAIRRLSQEEDLPRLVPTFLGAHAIPAEHAADRQSYVRLVIEEMLPAVVEGDLARFCDVFCEEGAFTLAESEQILERAAEMGLGLKIHAEEFTPLGGAVLAARLRPRARTTSWRSTTGESPRWRPPPPSPPSFPARPCSSSSGVMPPAGRSPMRGRSWR